ncbi:MAG: HNH endonuclease [Anaerolineae bacterium]|nr:HNH endonuclease [Anaerolineae bacterium]
MTYIGVEIRRQVIERAGNCCEYCLLSQEDSTFSFQVDHVIAEKHEGETVLENLSLSCPNCNSYKGSDIGSIDRETGKLTALYNPRIQSWGDHFRLDGPVIEPLTPEGRVTVRLLRLNRSEQIEERRGLIAFGRYPCTQSK